MAIQQTITLEKPAGSFSAQEEAIASIRSLVDSSVLAAIDNARTSGDFTTVANWDPVAQQITFVRTWNEDAYNAYAAAIAGSKDTQMASLEADGWTVTEVVATV